jgi:glycosyltransferase involved in cell wall biosynthesis
MQLSIALPCFNEEGNIEATIADITGWLDSARIEGEIVAVDDGSADGTLALLEALARLEPRLRVVAHPRNLGYGTAVRSGLDECRGEWIAFMDSDGQFRAADLDRLLALRETADIVVGRRRARADSWHRKLNARCFQTVCRLLFGVRVNDIDCAMKLIRRREWPSVRPRLTTGALFNLELFARIRRHGIAWRQVDVRHYPRRTGTQTGARPEVILRAARELLLLRLRLQ